LVLAKDKVTQCLSTGDVSSKHCYVTAANQ